MNLEDLKKSKILQRTLELDLISFYEFQLQFFFPELLKSHVTIFAYLAAYGREGAKKFLEDRVWTSKNNLRIQLYAYKKDGYIIGEVKTLDVELNPEIKLVHDSFVYLLKLEKGDRKENTN